MFALLHSPWWWWSLCQGHVTHRNASLPFTNNLYLSSGAYGLCFLFLKINLPFRLWFVLLKINLSFPLFPVRLRFRFQAE